MPPGCVKGTWGGKKIAYFVITYQNVKNGGKKLLFSQEIRDTKIAFEATRPTKALFQALAPIAQYQEFLIPKILWQLDVFYGGLD